MTVASRLHEFLPRKYILFWLPTYLHTDHYHCSWVNFPSHNPSKLPQPFCTHPPRQRTPTQTQQRTPTQNRWRHDFWATCSLSLSGHTEMCYWLLHLKSFGNFGTAKLLTGSIKIDWCGSESSEKSVDKDILWLKKLIFLKPEYIPRSLIRYLVVADALGLAGPDWI